ncbi:DDT domain-containing protein DDR4 [Olea europaea var. sylvestris]|uniref:DDT domain-containing protein DDR4 n=1 Tax=Olea europaea var. sylvestris TaxID=158386 RepID=UPI000C1D3419|nr:DDT domain-containing protein DDR4 [Olea europaea var. sylvestris]
MTGGNVQSDDVIVISESSPTAVEVELARQKLRQHGELASVLNFLNVFEPVMQSNIKVSAEEIEHALIEQNKLLGQLHKALLKGIHPVSKTLDSSDAWVIVLSKKLMMWWPWVAEGDFPLNGAKGEEISIYKELDPTVRLFILKALCEVRADQDDIVSYINHAIKSGTEVSTFRKDKLAGDEHGTAFWYDGNATIGYRLYKEVLTFESKPRVNVKDTVPAINSQWETLATNLEEFYKIVDELSSSEVKWEAVVSRTVETNAIPILEKLQKKKQRALQRQKREQILLNGIRTAGITRSCRNLRPVNYSFDDYDRTIKEAIIYTKGGPKMKIQWRRNQKIIGKNLEKPQEK